MSNKYRGHRHKSIVDDMKFHNGTPCFPWPGTINEDGYGSIWENGRVQKAHRAVFEKVNGRIPSGLVIDHLCKNRKCVNPDHLEAVTVRENARRSLVKELCKRGHLLSGDNEMPSKGGRRCRACSYDEARRRYARKRECALLGIEWPASPKDETQRIAKP